MLSRFQAALDGAQLAAIDESIVITDLRESADEIITAETGSIGNGSRFVRSKREKLTVTVDFCIREQDTARRMAVLARVQRWAAAGGLLTRDDRPGKRLRVLCDTPPALKSAMGWTDTFSVSFSAYRWPFWESIAITSITTDGHSKIFVDGTAACKADAHIAADADGLTELAVTTACGSIRLDDLALTAGQAVEIDHTEDGYLRIRCGDQSLLANRTPDSSDDLLLPAGHSDVHVSGNVPVRMTLRARGAWL